MLKLIPFTKALIELNKDAHMQLLDLYPIAVHARLKGSDVGDLRAMYYKKPERVYSILANVIDGALSTPDLDHSVYGAWAIIAPNFGDGRHVLLVRVEPPDTFKRPRPVDLTDAKWSLLTLLADGSCQLVQSVLPDCIAKTEVIVDDIGRVVLRR